MATKGTRTTSITFGSFEISASLVKAKKSRDITTELVDAAGVKISGGGGGYGGGRRKPNVEAGEARAVRVAGDVVIRLPQDELDAIEQESKDQWGAMQVLECIPYQQVPTERIEGSYWLQPAQGSAAGLYLLHKALGEEHKVAIVKWVSTSREKLGVIRPRWIRRDGKLLRALLLSELVFANDFADPDDDVLAVNEAEAMMQERDGDAHRKAVEQARNLIKAFAHERGDDKAVETASDEAVDARIALLNRLQDEQLNAALEGSTLTLRNVITGSVTWDDDVEAALAAVDVDPGALVTAEQLERAKDRTAHRGAERAVWIATGKVPEGAEVVSIDSARAA